MSAIVDALLQAGEIIFKPDVFIWLVLGVLFGISVGCIPGVGPVIGMSAVLPLTFFLEPISAILFLINIYSGAMFGAAIAAILINTPGAPAAAATTFDGYPMAKQGKAMDALSIAASSSALAGFFSVVFLIAASPLLIEFVLLFGSPEYFLIAILGLSLITIIARGPILKGLIAGGLGLLLTTIGFAPIKPDVRYTFDILMLSDGVSFIAALIGVFAITEMIKLSNKQGGIANDAIEVSGTVAEGVKTVLSNKLLILKSALIGIGIGAIPGAGATISTFVSYSEAVRSNPDETFGDGNSRGIVSTEAANNATVGSSLIPTLSFGIPGGGAAAVLLAALIMHGIRPGPDMFDANLFITYSIFLSLLVGNIVIIVVGLTLVTKFSYITQVDTNIIIPVVIVLSILSMYLIRDNWFDMFTVVLFGFIGIVMLEHDYSVIAFVLGIILGGIAEENLIRSIQLSDGYVDAFYGTALSILLLIAIVLVLIGPIVAPWVQRKVGL